MLVPFWQTEQHFLELKCQTQYFKVGQEIKARVKIIEYKSICCTFLRAHKNMKFHIWRQFFIL